MDKYYTPTIKEFYVGFECEMQSSELIAKEFGREVNAKLFDLKRKINKELCFAEHVITAHDIQFYSLNPNHLKNDIRIKHLDKEDIEALGWNFNREVDKWIFSYNQGLYDLKIWFHKDRIHIEVYNYLDATLFSGRIKNKSELKKLMEQLAITTT